MRRCRTPFPWIVGLCGVCAASACRDATSDAVLDALPRLDASVTEELEVQPVYPGHSWWNDYVARADPLRTVWEQDDVACSAEAAVRADDCFHAGVLRRMRIPQRQTCDGLSIADALGAFSWRCRVVSGAAEAWSTGLQHGKRLADLVDESSFRRNSVVVYSGETEIHRSAPEIWWPNSVQPLPANGGANQAVIALEERGAIYTLAASRQTHGYNINADHIAVVTLGESWLSLAADARPNCNAQSGELLPRSDDGFVFRPCVVSAGGQKHLWIEAKLGSYAGRITIEDRSTALQLNRVRHSAIRHMQVRSGGYGLQVRESTALRFGAIRVANVHFFAAILGDVQGSIVNDYTAHSYGGSNDGSAGLLIEGASSDNTLSRLHFSNYDGYGVLMIPEASRNTLTHVTAVNGGFAGMAARDNQSLTMVQIVLLNHRGPAFDAIGGLTATLSQLVLGHSSRGFEADGDAAMHVSLRDRLVVGNNGADCRVNCADCRIDNLSAASGRCVGNDPLHVTDGVDASRSFRERRVRSTSNKSEVTGQGVCDEIVDWTGFTQRPRGWGREGDGDVKRALDPSARNRCSLANAPANEPCRCYVYDWRLSSTDQVLRNASQLSGSQGDVEAGKPCPPAADGDRALTDAQGNAFLINALELGADGIGDDDGLCESGEACLFSPNLGYYQGEYPATLGDMCDFADGIVSGVELYSWGS